MTNIVGVAGWTTEVCVWVWGAGHSVNPAVVLATWRRGRLLKAACRLPPGAANTSSYCETERSTAVCVQHLQEQVDTLIYVHIYAALCLFQSRRTKLFVTRDCGDLLLGVDWKDLFRP